MSLLHDQFAGPVLSLLSVQNIESELSYAYLHAVAAQAGVSCTQGSRHEDNHGIDARLLGLAPFPAQGKRTEVDINIQLKATVKEPALIDGSFSYSLDGIARYDQLRSMTRSIPRILVVLFMPAQSTHWITHTEDALALHKCAYWVSLRNAPASSNVATQTVYLPQAQRFDADGLRRLMGSISRGEVPEYQGRKM